MTQAAGAAPASLRAALVRRPHGVGGEVRVENLGGDPRRFRTGLTLTVEATGRRLTVSSVRAVGGSEVLLGFEGIDTADAAGPLRGAYLCVPSARARRLGRNEWFVWQLVGLEAVDAEGGDLGVVSDVEAGTVHDIVVVKSETGERRFPMVTAFVSGVDLEARRIVLTPWPEDA